ncbi:reverse transcriptase domain-containing protein [Tanacetum coccineum]
MLLPGPNEPTRCGGGSGGAAVKQPEGEGKRVETRDTWDWVDRATRKLFGFGRKSPPEKFSGGGWPEKVAVAGGEGLPEIPYRERDHYYDIELADGRIIGLNTILRGCTLNFLNHPFNINLMPVELGSFDAIIGMDWLAKYQEVILCAERRLFASPGEMKP